VTEQASIVERAGSLDGEFEQLQQVLSDLADHARKRAYADWLTQQGDARGEFLKSVLDDWDAGQKELATDDTINSAWKDTCGVTLLQKLREGKLDSLAPAICAVARPALKITVIPAEDEIPVGATKFGGKPDLNAEISWPQYEGKLHTFIGQFRLEDLQQTQAGTLLPGAGLLSFFMFDDPVETGQPAAEGAEGAWQVVYSPDASRLRRCDPPKAFDEGNRLALECVIQMQETLDLPNVNTYELDRDYADQFIACRRAKSLGLQKEHGDAYEAILEALLPEREERSHLMGWSHPQVLADDPVEENYRHLLTVASEEILEWCWADGHQLFFSLSPDDLSAGEFEHVAITDG
jgi:uncharacterized protein (TIGR02996 family)